MKLVIDTNRVMAAFLKDSICREIIFSKKHEFFTSPYGIKELLKYKEYICKKASITNNEFVSLFSRQRICYDGKSS